MAMYESEHTKFMREWLERHPEEFQVQQSGRALWWDRGSQDMELQRRYAEARIPAKPYYYDAN